MNENKLSEQAIRQKLEEAERYRFELHERIDSTNRRARELAMAGAPSLSVVLAECQEGGQGRFGRPFFSPAGGGIYLSLILRPALPPDRVGHITPFAAVAVARAVDALAGTSVGIKWVNDLFLGERKICGILSEASLHVGADRPDHVIVGIGVNVRDVGMPPELEGIASSIEKQSRVVLDRNALIAAILNHMTALEYEVRAGNYLDEYRARSILLGREVTVSVGEETFAATVRGIDDEASLLVRCGDEERRIHAGEVSIRL